MTTFFEIGDAVRVKHNASTLVSGFADKTGIIVWGSGPFNNGELLPVQFDNLKAVHGINRNQLEKIGREGA